MTSLAGQTVLVTGANRGMGREYIGQLLERGVTKVYAAARDARGIDATDPRVIPLQLDITDATSVAKAGQAASDVSVLINNAGIARHTSVLSHRLCGGTPVTQVVSPAWSTGCQAVGVSVSTASRPRTR